MTTRQTREQRHGGERRQHPRSTGQGAHQQRRGANRDLRPASRMQQLAAQSNKERSGGTVHKISESRAACLLGLETAELRRLSRETGMGETVSQNGAPYLIFTYAELYRLCRVAAQLTTQ